MKSIKWESHYTGIDTAQIKRLYLQRDSKTKRLTFARLSIGKRMIGIFLGRQNYAGGIVKGGFQLFTNGFHFGIGRGPIGYLKSYKNFTVKYSGSMVDPYHTVSIILFKQMVIGMKSPKWLVKYKEKKASEEMWKWG